MHRRSKVLWDGGHKSVGGDLTSLTLRKKVSEGYTNSPRCCKECQRCTVGFENVGSVSLRFSPNDASKLFKNVFLLKKNEKLCFVADNFQNAMGSGKCREKRGVGVLKSFRSKQVSRGHFEHFFLEEKMSEGGSGSQSQKNVSRRHYKRSMDGGQIPRNFPHPTLLVLYNGQNISFCGPVALTQLGRGFSMV